MKMRYKNGRILEKNWKDFGRKTEEMGFCNLEKGCKAL